MKEIVIVSISNFLYKFFLLLGIIDDVIRATEPDRQKVLIVDRKSVTIIDAAMRTNTVVNEKVTLIEQLEKARQPFPLPAIYFVTPTSDIITRLIDDFSRKGPPLYNSAYLFFTSSLDEINFKRLTKSPAAPYIKGVKEMFLDFLSLESEIFSCNRPLAFNSMYAPNSLTVAAELNTIANQVRL